MPIRYSIGGLLVAGQRWSVTGGLGMVEGSAPTNEEMSALADAILAAFKTQVWGTASATDKTGTQVGSRGNVDQCRTYYVNAPAAPAIRVGISTAAAAPGFGTSTAVPQVALVCTLLTGIAGRSYRGRVYLPAAQGTDANGRINASSATNTATNYANFLSAIALVGGTIGDTVFPAVLSATQNDTTPITAVRCDNVLDTQRRRRDKVLPSASPSVNVVVG